MYSLANNMMGSFKCTDTRRSNEKGCNFIEWNGRHFPTKQLDSKTLIAQTPSFNSWSTWDIVAYTLLLVVVRCCTHNVVLWINTWLIAMWLSTGDVCTYCHCVKNALVYRHVWQMWFGFDGIRFGLNEEYCRFWCRILTIDVYWDICSGKTWLDFMYIMKSIEHNGGTIFCQMADKTAVTLWRRCVDCMCCSWWST